MNEEYYNILEMLNSDAEFAKMVADIRKSTTMLYKSVQDTKETSEKAEQKMSELSDRCDRLETLLMDLRQERDALQADIQKHESVLEEMQRLEESFNGAVQAYGNIQNVYKIFEERIEKLEGKKGTGGKQKKEEPVSVPEAEPFEKFPNVDYDEVTSVEKLFAKYNGKIDGPVIVVRTKNYPWNGDYCMAVKSVNNGKAWGVRYSYGIAGKKTPLKADEEEYSMYCGPSYNKIVEDFKK